VPKDCWTLLSTRHVSDQRIFQLRHDRYRFEPTGAEREFVVLDAPDWINIVPLTDDGHVVMIRQYRHGIREVTLEIPGGVIDGDESPESAAVRELEEETGYAAHGVRLLGRLRPNPAFLSNTCHLFVAEGCRQRAAPRPDPFERIDVVLISQQAIPDLVRRGEINHGLVINALTFAGLVRYPSL
jgi:ADP-ribose pyrophosphatase